MENPASNGTAAYPMSPEDVASLAEVARGLRLFFISGMVRLGCYGAYVALAGVALYSISKWPGKRAGIWMFLILALGLSFTITTLQTVSLLHAAVFRMTTTLVENQSMDFPARMDAYATSTWHRATSYIVTFIDVGADAGLMFVINDCLAGWRAMSIWDKDDQRTSSRIALFALRCLCWATIVFWVPTTVLQCLALGNPVQNNSDPGASLGILSSVISVAVDVLATSMMGYTAYRHWRACSRKGTQTLHTGRILVMLTESGFLYAIIQIIRLALTVSVGPSTPLHGSLWSATEVIMGLTSVLAAMYPPALILIITHGYSIANVAPSDLKSDPEWTDNLHSLPVY